VLEARSDTKFLTNSANPTLSTLFGSHRELGGVSDSNTLSKPYNVKQSEPGLMPTNKKRIEIDT
jgi:hypothetical protein